MNKILLAYFLPLDKDNHLSPELLRVFANKYATRALCMAVLFIGISTTAETIGENWLHHLSLSMGCMFSVLFGIFAGAALDPRLR